MKQRERVGGEEGRCSPPPLPPPLPPPPTPPPPSFLPLSPPKSPCREEKVQAWIVKQQWQKFFCLFLFCFSFCGARLQGTKWLPRTGNGENEGEQKLRCFYDLTLFQFQPQLSLLWWMCVCVSVRVCGRLAYRQGASLFPIPLPPAALFCRQPSRKWSD